MARSPSAVSIGTTVRLRGLDGRHGRLADAWGEPRAVSRAVEGPSPGQLLATPPPTELELNARRLSARLEQRFQKRIKTDFLTK